MSSPHQSEDRQDPETVDDLMLRDNEPDADSDDRARTASSFRDIASRIPESLTAIGRDISRTIERAMSAKDDYVVAVKISPEAQEKLEQLVQAGVFRNRAEAAGFLIDEGIRTQAALFSLRYKTVSSANKRISKNVLSFDLPADIWRRDHLRAISSRAG